MTTWARLVNNQAVDVVTTAPGSLFHADIAAEFVVVPDGTLDGATTANGGETFAPPIVYAPPTPPATYTSRLVDVGPFLASITSSERVALRASLDELVKEFVTMCVDPRITSFDLNLPSVQFDINYAAGLVKAPTGAPNAGNFLASPCIGLNGDGAARAAAILSGNPLAATS